MSDCFAELFDGLLVVDFHEVISRGLVTLLIQFGAAFFLGSKRKFSTFALPLPLALLLTLPFFIVI